jgi:hypothetical protein
MNRMNKTLLAGIIASTVALPLAASADVIAQSVLSLTNFQIKGEDGLALSYTDDFAALIFNDNTDASATLGGTTVNDSLSSSVFGTLDLAQQWVSDGSFGENDYTHHGAVPTTTVARGDTLLAGSPLADTGQPLGASADTLAEVQIQNWGTDGTSTSNLGLIATFSFALANSQAATLAFDADNYLIAALTADARVPGSVAQASSGWSVDITESNTGTTVFEWTPDGNVGAILGGTEAQDDCDLSKTVAAQLPGQTALSTCSGSFEATTGTLTAGTLYTLNIRHTSEADATNVPIPEPSILALAGLGLLGMGGAVSRRRKAG